MDISAQDITDEASPLKNLERALQREVACGKRNKLEADFREAYPLLEQSLSRKLTRKAVVKAFNAAYGHKLHLPGFRDLLHAERKRRRDSGEEAVCPGCGNRLQAPEEAVEDEGGDSE